MIVSLQSLTLKKSKFFRISFDFDAIAKNHNLDFVFYIYFYIVYELQSIIEVSIYCILLIFDVAIDSTCYFACFTIIKKQKKIKKIGFNDVDIVVVKIFEQIERQKKKTRLRDKIVVNVAFADLNSRIRLTNVNKNQIRQQRKTKKIKTKKSTPKKLQRKNFAKTKF